MSEAITIQTTQKTDRQWPELLAPAGDAECIRAAIENGADAVYFGLNHGFNARARAVNFSVYDLPEVLNTLHRRRVKGYVTLNTLAYSNELAELAELVPQLVEARVDAVLVQDLGLARLIRELSPDLPLHASTQMTITSAECLQAIHDLRLDRVVLARELSLAEIREIRQATDVPLEVFVHGALCVAYSGQCLTSESLGGRSANRGQCAQACRLQYDLVCDGADVDLGPQKYLLSPRDLAAYDLTPELIAAGISSFKIEGRLKTAEYVANLTRHYRRAIDAAMAGSAAEFTADDVREMELSFSRGFSHGWLDGCDHKYLVPALSSSKRGVWLGTVQGVTGDRVRVRVSAPVAPGDGIVFEGDRSAQTEQGGRVFAVFSDPRGGRFGGRTQREATEVELTFAPGSLDFSRITPGLPVWKTDDPRLTRRLRATFTGPDPVRKLPVTMHVVAQAGEPLQVTASVVGGPTVTVTSAEPLPAARNRPATLEFFQEQLSRLGHTQFALADLSATITAAPMVPLSLLSDVRQELIRVLDAALTETPIGASGNSTPSTKPPISVLSELRNSDQAAAAEGLPAGAAKLHVLCRSLTQLEVCLDQLDNLGELLVEFADIREYGPATERALAAGRSLWLATPRIQKPGEAPLFKAMTKHGATGLLVRNLAGLAFCQEQGLRSWADFSLNAANELTVAYLRTLGAERITASYDLNRDQLLQLVAQHPPVGLEVVLHQHMPMFHMEHCVFCAVLSPGTNKHNCGRPCDDHRVELRDRVGRLHPLTADVGCRNTLYNATPQSAAEAVPELLAAGVREFRVELLDEGPADVVRTVQLYQRLLHGETSPKHVWQSLKALNHIGVTRGTLED